MPGASTVGRYEVLGQLATGGMAEILLGRVSGPSGFERPVVIKRILPHLSDDPGYRAMFLDEARIVARIRHDNVVHVHELGSDDGALFLVMEYLEGESVGGLLRRLLAERRTLDHWLACYIAAEACAGLHAAQELRDDQGELLGLVHRDISPQNIFIGYDGAVKILDFGIAKVRDKSVRTATGQLKGKFQYMSPEQCLGKALDRRSDIWSLGVVLYELSTLTRPFKRDNELLTFKAICEEPLLRPSQLDAAFPPALEPIILRATARDPELRYATAKEMRADLLSAMRELERGVEPRDALAELMSREFAGRRQEKLELLTHAAQGESPRSIPAAEVDEDVELPGVTEMASAVRAAPPPEPRRGRWWALAAVAAFSAMGAVYMVRFRGAEASGAPTARAELRAAAPVNSVWLHVVTRPPGARISFDGRSLGVSPLKTALLQNSSGVLAAELSGHRRLERSVSLEREQTLDLSLEPLPEPASPPPTTASPPARRKTSSSTRKPAAAASIRATPVEVPVW